MSTFSLSRRPQMATAQASVSRTSSIAPSRAANNATINDPLQPLRAMADRVGKEVEKFAERVDHWHTHGNEDDRAKYNTTVKLVDKLRDYSESAVKDLKKRSSMENQGELDKSVRRRIQGLADDEGVHLFSQSVRNRSPAERAVASSPSSVRELRQWQDELATWELVRTVIEHRHPEPGTDVEARKAAALARAGGTSRHSPKHEVWNRFILADDAAREKKVILKWLQLCSKNSEGDIDSIVQQWGAVSGKDTNTWTSGWLDTKAKIKQAKRMQGADGPLDEVHMIKNQSSVAPLVTRLDPDAVNRQKRALEKSDEYYENALWMVCYEMLRRGEPWDKISEWCKERSEAWRGVSLGASYTSHVDGAPNLAGNDMGYLFRRMCFYASRGAKMPYEGVVYALLSGDTKRVHETCRSWDDHLYAYYNALLLSKFDRYLKQNPQPQAWVSDRKVLEFVFHDESSHIGSWESSNQKVIELLKRNPTTSAEAKSPIKLIQGALISGTLEDLLCKVGIAIADMLQDDDRMVNLTIDPDTENPRAPTSKKSKESRAVSADDYYQTLAKDPQALRILTHLVLIFVPGLDAIKWKKDREAFAMQNVVTAYIEFLRITKRVQLIPLYASQLGNPRAYHCMARVLPDIKNNEEQKRCLTLLDTYQMDVVRTVVEGHQLMLMASGLVEGTIENAREPITKFEIVEKWKGKDAYLWPGLRVKATLDGLDITAGEEALLESLQWFNYLETEYEHTFVALHNSLAVLLLNGRLGAAEKLATELSVEAISLTKTKALCGYAFDFTQAGAEEQDEEQVTEAMRRSSSGADLVRPSRIPSAHEHAVHVHNLRTESRGYYDVSQIVRLIALFRQWRSEEETLIQQRDTAQPVSTKRAKDLFNTIGATFASVIDPSMEEDLIRIYYAYYPDILLAYLSILQSGSFFIHRDSATKAMDLATLVADQEREWLQKILLQMGRMSEFVGALAHVSKAMLRLGEHDSGKGKVGKKRGGKGEALRIWDVNVRN